MGIAIRLLLAFIVYVMAYTQEANALSCAGYPNPTACAAALGLVDPRNFGAACAGVTWNSGGTPVQVGSHDDTFAFEQAEYVAAASGAGVMVPDGCWVSNLKVLDGITFVGENWAPNYGYDYGNGSFGNLLLLTPGSGYTNGTYALSVSGGGTGSGFAGTVTVSGGSLTSYTVSNNGGGYPATATIPIPAGAGSGTGGLIQSFVRPKNQPFSKPVLYIIGTPTYAVNWSGAETVGFVGFEINANSNAGAFGVTTCEGGTSTTAGFGGKVWNFQMSFKGCEYGIQDPSCYDYLVSENSDYGANQFGIGGCFSDFLSNGDTFVSNTYGIVGSGGGFARVIGDRFEYEYTHISPSSHGFLEWTLIGSQFDHSDSCAIDIGTTWNEFNVTGGTIKAGGVDGSLTVTGSAAYADGQIELTVNSAVSSIHGGEATTAPFSKVKTAIDTSTSSITIGTGTQTFTTTLSDGLHSGITNTDGSQPAGSAVFTSSAATFTSGNVGDVLNITSCSGTGCIDGFYRIVSFTSAHVVVLDRTATDGIHAMSSAHYTAAVPLLIYDSVSNGQTNWMYGTVTSDTATTLVMNITSVGGSGTIATWSFGRPYYVNVNYVGGTTEANANNQLVTVVDGSHIVLQNSTWVNAWTSGGYAGIQGIDSDICMEGTTNKNGGLTLSNVEFASSSAVGGSCSGSSNPGTQCPAPAYIFESSTSGANNDNIGVYGGALFWINGTNVQVNYNSFTLNDTNWIVSAPTHYFRQALGMNAIVTPQIMGGALFGISGCSTTNSVGGAAGGQFVSGTSGTCTPTITMADQGKFPPPNGWFCSANDITAGTALPQTASTTTTATFSGSTTSGDVINFMCFGY